MKNLLILFVSVSFFFLASCSKDALEPSAVPNLSIEERNTTVDLHVTGVAFSIISQEVVVDYSAQYDFTESVLINAQTLNFDDAGNTTSFNLSVNRYTGNNGTLQVIYNLGGNNLTGLGLEEVQQIIIEDELID